MTRGIIYHITTDPHSIGCMDESDFYESTDLLDVNSVENQNRESAVFSLERLEYRLRTVGFCIKDTKEPNAAFMIVTGSKESNVANKILYFADRFHILKNEVEHLTEEKFASDLDEINRLVRIIGDPYSDIVYFDAGTGPSAYSFDGFIRRLEPEKTYYVSANTVYMD